jgi:hypothetical protein
MPNYARPFVCEICQSPEVQYGPGRSQRVCSRPQCQAKLKNRRRKAWVSDYLLRP